MTDTTTARMDSMAEDQHGPVALHLRQKLVPVEGPEGVIFPPTYAIEGKYVVDKLADGTEVAQIDSVGSQANRMEPLFKEHPELVPQIEIRLPDGKTVSLLDAGHRLGDALIRSTRELADRAQKAFEALEKDGNAEPIARLAPTSLVFGVWDSRGNQQKRPRLINAVIRSWDVQRLRRAATYIPPVDYAELEVFGEQEKAKAARNSKSPLAQRGFVHNPAEDVGGGIVVHGGTFRDVTVNLVALRTLDGPNGSALRRYILGLTLVAATASLDGFLRQGCLLVPDPDFSVSWSQVTRMGERKTIALTSDVAFDYAQGAAKDFGVADGEAFHFDKELARADVRK